MLRLSNRTWKHRLKEWGYTKQIRTEDANFVIGEEDRKAQEHEETVSFHKDANITANQRIEYFQGKKATAIEDPVSSTAGMFIYAISYLSFVGIFVVDF